MSFYIFPMFYNDFVLRKRHSMIFLYKYACFRVNRIWEFWCKAAEPLTMGLFKKNLLKNKTGSRYLCFLELCNPSYNTLLCRKVLCINPIKSHNVELTLSLPRAKSANDHSLPEACGRIRRVKTPMPVSRLSPF